MTSPVVKRSVVVSGHNTSVGLEDEFWKALKEISRDRGMTLSELVSAIDGSRRGGNLSSAIRVFVLDHFHRRAVAAAKPAAAKPAAARAPGAN
jgi:predicted DNA-binding ribbon-helix-helix protein